MAQPLEILRSSASLHGQASYLRDKATVSKYIDTTTCIGCKACEVACQEWNDLPTVKTEQVGSYQTLPSLHASFWNLIKFHEEELPGGGLAWLMRKDQCMHCADPGCLTACPADGAIVQYTNGIVDFNQEHCIGCQYCLSGCPFNIPKFNPATKKVYKCTLCSDRVGAGLEPACIKACPTGCLHFGSKEDMKFEADKRVKQLKANGQEDAGVYNPGDPNGGSPGSIGGTHVIYVLNDLKHPEKYGDLPADPSVPFFVTMWKGPLKWLGGLGIAFGMLGVFMHRVRYGAKKVEGEENRA